MNKKFSTLAVGLLLAGGLFSTANAQESKWFLDVADNGFYHVLKVHGSKAGVPYAESWSVSIVDGKIAQEQGMTAVNKNNAWKVTSVKVNGEAVGYELTNANGVKLQFDKDGEFTTEASKVKYSVFKFNETKLYPVNATGLYLKQAGSGYKLDTEGTDTKLYTLPTYKATATDVNGLLEDGFSITIGKTKLKNGDPLVWDGAYELEGNVFTGKLTLNPDGTLTKENGKQIVLTKSTWGTLSNSLQAIDKSGFKWAEYSPAEMTANEKNILATTFTLTVPNAITNEPIEIVAGGKYELMVATVNGVNYLTTGAATDALNGDSQLVGEASFTNNAQADKAATENTYVKFGDGNDVDYAIFNDALWNIYKTEDKETLVAGPSCFPTWVPAAQVATEYPEGQWLWNGTQFVNRESGKEIPIKGLRKTDKDLVFTANDVVYTFVKAGEPGHSKAGYLNGTNDDFLKEAFYIGTPVKATNDIVYIAKADNGALYLTTDKAAAVEFRLKKETWTDDNDLVRHYTDYATSKKNFVAKDTLNLHKYFVSEAATGANLAYDKTNQIFILSKDAKQYQSLVFKNKAEGIYNLVQSLATAAENDTKQNYLNQIFDEFCKAKKLYGAHNTAELKQADKAYAYVANDLFILEKVDAGQHVSGIEGKNIKIMRNADNNYVLYETGSLLETENEVLEGFLGIQNFLDPKYSEKNAAMYVDPAAGMDTWRPEYLLALDWKEVPAGKICPIHGDDPTCPDAHKVETRGYSEGRYLVNLVDSADVRKDCKFQNYSGDDYYRLGFVQAKHIGDTLAIASTGDSLNLTGNDFAKMNVCEFAFHYTDANREAFTIETAYSALIADKEAVLFGDAEKEGELISSIPGYVKFHNGIPVVTKEASEAEVFVLAETEEAPTANEAIEAAGVQVIGGQGVVTVQGAAGKVITVADILGRTIANQVAASDNVTIAVPAGIVVVAVEGEATKVVVK
ncbi:MAG: DUF6383 domain-containing protein [Parabacteroides sp.]|nr:DUF6383 domain-containing protein [Parabacteroides sp.]